MPVFDHLVYWEDGVPRKGSENMAHDQCLLEQIGEYPVLRVYDWCEPSVSFGYFHKLADVKQACSFCDGTSMSYVRRWTGGGIVDHRIDLTYSLIIPQKFELGHTRGSSSYHVIHRELCEVLRKLGQRVEVAKHERGYGSVCFDNPVIYDLMDQNGHKIAGAGQRRTKHGLLHQGSVVTNLQADVFGQEFAKQLAANIEEWQHDHSHGQRVSEIEAGRYANENWLMKR